MDELIVFIVIIGSIAALLLSHRGEPSKPAGIWRSHSGEIEPNEPVNHIWGKFAARHRLTFVSDSLLTGSARMYGVYRGYNFGISEVEAPNGVCTNVVVNIKDPSSRKRMAIASGISANSMSQSVLALLAPSGFQGVSGEITSNGQQIHYQITGVLTGEQIEHVCRLLSELADGYSAVVALGGAAVPALQTLVGESDLLRGVSIEMLKDISQTTQHLSDRAERLLCSHCLVHFYAHRADLPGQPDVTYYGCRACHQSKEMVECPRVMVAVLDVGWRSPQDLRAGLLRINWLMRHALFDFDRVEIVRATDKDVEQFAVQVGNDTDPIRKPRYAQMRCVVNQACGLSENTLRVLESTFGRVETQA